MHGKYLQNKSHEKILFNSSLSHRFYSYILISMWVTSHYLRLTTTHPTTPCCPCFPFPFPYFCHCQDCSPFLNTCESLYPLHHLYLLYLLNLLSLLSFKISLTSVSYFLPQYHHSSPVP